MTALTDRALDDTYKDLLQVSNSNTGITTTRTAIEDGEGTSSVLKLATTSYGADGRVYVELDSGSTDLAATLEALDTTAINHLVIDKPGTYITGPWTINNLRALTIGPGVTLQFKALQANDAKMLTIARADFVLHLYGTLDGNYAAQDTATGHSAIYTTSDRVKVLGYGKLGYITGWRGNAVYPVNCDDFEIDGVRIDNCLSRCIYGQLLTTGQTLARFTARNIVADRTAQGSGATEGCVEVENQAGGSDVITDPVIENVFTYLDAGAGAFGIEVYGGVAGGLVRPVVRNTYGSGGAAALSVDHATGGILENIRAYNGNENGIEIAHCTGGLTLNGFTIDCNGVATSTGVIVDNQNDNGNDVIVANGTVINPTTYGIHLKGASGGTQPKQTTVSNVTVRAAAASAVGFLAEYAPGARFASCRFYGSAASQEGLVVFQSAGAAAEGISVEFTAGATNAIRVEAVTDFVLCNANLIGGGTANNALTLIDVQRLEATNITAKTFDTRLLEIVVNSGQTIANLNIEIAGDGNGDVTLTNNSGTVSGDTIQLHIRRGWTPYGKLTNPKFLRFHGTTSSSNVLVEGYFTDNPNSDPIPYQGYGYYNGNLYTNKAGTWTVVN